MFFSAAAATTPSKQRDAADAEHQPDRELPRALAHDHSQNAPRIRAQRHANAELLRALIDRKTHHAVEADTGKNEGDDSEDGEERRDHAIAGENLVVKLRRRSGEIGREIGVERGDGFAQRRPERIGALTGARPNEYRGRTAWPATRRAAACRSPRPRSADRTDLASTCPARRPRWFATAVPCRD